MMEDLTGEEVARLLKGEHVPRRPSALNKAATPAEGQRRANGGPAVRFITWKLTFRCQGQAATRTAMPFGRFVTHRSSSCVRPRDSPRPPS